MRETEFSQNLKNLSDVGRDQVICLKLVCATRPLSEMYWEQLGKNLTLSEGYNHIQCL